MFSLLLEGNVPFEWRMEIYSLAKIQFEDWPTRIARDLYSWCNFVWIVLLKQELLMFQSVERNYCREQRFTSRVRLTTVCR